MPRKKSTEEPVINEFVNEPTIEAAIESIAIPDDQTVENAAHESAAEGIETTTLMSIETETEVSTMSSTGAETEASTTSSFGVKNSTTSTTEIKTEKSAPENFLSEDDPEETAAIADEIEVPAPIADRTAASATASTRKRTTRPSVEKLRDPAPVAPLPVPIKRPSSTSILTISSDGEVETPEAREDLVWHELQNAYRTRKILTGNLGGIERMEGGGSIAIVYYKELRVAIPISEMMIHLVEDDSHDYGELASRQNKIIGNMLGAEIDFMIKGLDVGSRSVVASRKDAMYKKRQIFYLPDASGNSRVYEDRIVQARVIAVAEKVVRVEIFGVECSILARDLSWDWLGDANERFQVGEQILVRILQVQMTTLEDVSIKADVKSVAGNSSKANLNKCKVQGKYAGTVTDIHKGTVFVRLSIGVNAIAHSCYDNRMPGKKDEVSFVITRIDEERNVAVGLISRIIRSNI